jgi:hypothetical protein
VDVPFVENRGQITEGSVRYYAKTFGGTVFVSEDGSLVYSLPASRPGTSAGGWALRERLVDARRARPTGVKRASTKVSRFVGPDPAAWRSRLSAYDEVSLGRPYPGIEVLLRASGGNVEKVFVVNPGADPDTIRLRVEGVDGLSVDDDGRLVLATGLGPVTFTRPVAYQGSGETRRAVEVAYEVSEGEYGFAVGHFDDSQPLVIDPLLASTFIGGSNDAYALGPTDDVVRSMLVVGDHVYAAGATTSTDFPTRLGAFDIYQGGIGDGFVAMFDSDLSQLVAATFVGSATQDWVNAIAADATGAIYATGYTNGQFPTTPGAYTGTNGVSGPFIVKLSADLGTLIASAVLGVGSDTSASAIAHAGGAVYISGAVTSTFLPTTPGAYDSTCGTDGKCNPTGAFGVPSSDAFVSKLSDDLSQLLASTYLGSSSTDSAAGIGVDAAGHVVVVGTTQSTGFPVTPGAFQEYAWGLNLPVGFVSKLDGDLSNLVASSLLGGSDGRSAAAALEVGADSVLIGGTTYASDFPFPAGGYDTLCGSDGFCDPFGPANVHRSDGFLIALSGDLGSAVAGTYVGGARDDGVNAISVDAAGTVTATGGTESTDVPLGPDPLDATPNGGRDAFVVRFDAALQNLLAGTYLGGTVRDEGRTTATDALGNVYVGGVTASTDFPVTDGAFDVFYNGGGGDGFVSKLDAGLSSGGANQAPFASAGPDQWIFETGPVILNGAASEDPDGTITAYQWTQVSGPTVRIYRPDRAVAGFYVPRLPRFWVRAVFQLTVTDDDGRFARRPNRSWTTFRRTPGLRTRTVKASPAGC